MPESSKEKISMFSHVAKEQVICLPDVNNIYQVPLILFEYNLAKWFAERLSLKDVNYDLRLASPINDIDCMKNSNALMQKWADLAERSDNLTKVVIIAMVGKYTTQTDTYKSIITALANAGLEANRKVVINYVDSSDLEKSCEQEDPVKYHEAWQNVCKADGVLVPGGFGSRGVEGKILAANWARINSKPYLGICLGFQCAVIEFSRNVLNLKDANSAEFSKETPNQVVIEMPEHNQGQMGGTMRLGKRRTLFIKDTSILKKLYGNVDHVDERHRHRYEVNPKYVNDLENHGMIFTGRSEDGNRMEVMELNDHPYYVGVQYHPEYLSRPTKPSPPYVGFILASCSKLKPYLKNLANNNYSLEHASATINTLTRKKSVQLNNDNLHHLNDS